MTTEYTIELIQPDEAGVTFFLTHYKAFRLEALQNDPSFFGSSYAREAPMPDEFWRNRVLNPSAKIYVAVSSEDRSILFSVTMIRDVPVPPELRTHLANGTGHEKGDMMHWAVNGVYTAPRARRRGIAREVMTAAIKGTRDIASSEGKPGLITVLVKNDNTSARALYEKLGFKVTECSEEEDTARLVLLPAHTT